MSMRAQFFAAFLAMVVAAVALTIYGFHSLMSAADDGAKTNADINRLQVISDVEDDVRDAGAAKSPDAYEKQIARLDRDIAKYTGLPADTEDEEAVANLLRRVEAARDLKSADGWFEAGKCAGDIEDRIIKRAHAWGKKDDEHRRATRLILLGGIAFALFAAASAIVLVRWQRERDETQERLRRSDRLAALGTIAASVAHEINNPLATISGCAAAVGDRMKRQPNACVDSLEYLEMIQDESRRCAGILKSLRDLARDGPPAMTPADVAKIVRSVVALIEVDRGAKAVTFSVAGDERLDAICDPDKLKQLLLNLLINAREASEPGGTVTVTVGRAGAQTARIEVADRGRGIEKRDLVRIFEPFHTDKTQGLGIGLFLCERIAALHGGTIRAFSDGRGKGARFVVEFPTRTPAIVPADAVS
jgi:signal transduction histidine kinase